MKKAIAVFLPVLPQKSYVESLAQSLSFLHEDYHLDFIDPYDIHGEMSHEVFYHRWKEEIKKMLTVYDAFLGFSFGGVILQQCFSLFESIKRPIILFSTPTVADEALKQKLGEVIRLSRALRINEALLALYRHVFYPNAFVQTTFLIDNKAETADRLISGLERVLETDSTSILNTSTVEHTHFIGEHSSLVTQDHVILPKNGHLFVVPQTGMRVLQDNLDYCKPIILEELTRER